MEISNLISLISGAVVALFNIIIVLVALRKKKETINNDEKNKLNDIINDQMNMAIENIKGLCKTNNLIFNAKQTNKITKKIIKENKKDGN